MIIIHAFIQLTSICWVPTMCKALCRYWWCSSEQTNKKSLPMCSVLAPWKSHCLAVTHGLTHAFRKVSFDWKFSDEPTRQTKQPVSSLLKRSIKWLKVCWDFHRRTKMRALEFVLSPQAWKLGLIKPPTPHPEESPVSSTHTGQDLMGNKSYF